MLPRGFNGIAANELISSTHASFSQFPLIVAAAVNVPSGQGVFVGMTVASPRVVNDMTLRQLEDYTSELRSWIEATPLLDLRPRRANFQIRTSDGLPIIVPYRVVFRTERHGDEIRTSWRPILPQQVPFRGRLYSIPRTQRRSEQAKWAQCQRRYLANQYLVVYLGDTELELTPLSLIPATSRNWRRAFITAADLHRHQSIERLYRAVEAVTFMADLFALFRVASMAGGAIRAVQRRMAQLRRPRPAAAQPVQPQQAAARGDLRSNSERAASEADRLTGPRMVHGGIGGSERLGGAAFRQDVDQAAAQVDDVFDAMEAGSLSPVVPQPIARRVPAANASQLRRIYDAARQAFNGIRDGFARRLGLVVGDGGQVHHAIELNVVKLFPDAFRVEELNHFRNMRGIPPERTRQGIMASRGGRQQLHGAAIRRAWNRHYRRLNQILAQRHNDASDPLRYGNEHYVRQVRDYIETARDEIDHLMSQHFSEYRSGLTWRANANSIDVATRPHDAPLDPPPRFLRETE